MPTLLCPHCRSMVQVTIPELEVPSIALAILPAMVAAVYEKPDRDGWGDYCVEESYRVAEEYVKRTHEYLRRKAVKDAH